MAKRKRAPAPKTSVSEPNHFQRVTTTAACPNNTVSVPDTEPPQPPRRGRGRPRKLRPFSDNSEPNVAASPERRSSRNSEHDADLSAHKRQIPKRESMPRVAREMNTVVKVFCENSEQSSGFIIEGKRVLTNAHLVENSTQIELKKRGSDSKYLAAVLDSWAECGIAMLTVNDDEFWEGVSAVEFGDLPAILDNINVLGYQIGDDTISVTSGVVSCIEVRSYVDWLPELLGLQIDAAINSGISGGPAFNDMGKCVGITFQSLGHEDVENVGYVVPTLVIMRLIQNHEKNLACTENYQYKASGDRSQGRGQEVLMQDTPNIILAPSESGAPLTCSGGGDDLDALPSPMSGACSATSSIIRKRTRGPTRCLKLAILKPGEKLPVEFESVGGQPVGENARELITYLGVIVRNVANVPLQVKGWKSVPMDMKQKLLDAIQEKFDILDSPFIKKSLLEQMSDRYRNYRHELKVSFYDAYSTDEERLQNPPPDVPLDDWTYLIKYFGSDEYLAKSSRNKANRACNEAKHCSGQKSFARVKYDRTKSTGIEPGRISMFKITHQRGDGSFIDKNSEEIMSKIEQLVTEQGKGSSSIDEDEMFTHAAGKDTRRVRGLGRGPTPTVYYGHRHRQNFLVQQTEEAMRRAEKACKEAEMYKRQAEDAWKKMDKLRNQLQTQIDSFMEEMRRRL